LADEPAHPHDLRTSHVTEPRPTTSPDAAAIPAPEPYERRWLALGVIAMTVLLVILDATIVNIALPPSPPTWASVRRPSSGSSPPTR
jgi:hypothetical protein